MGGNNRYSELVMNKAEAYTGNRILTTCNFNARGTEMAVQPDRYRVRRKGLSLCQLSLPADLSELLVDAGVNTIERLYGAMLGNPTTMRPLLAQHGLTYDEVVSLIKARLPLEEQLALENAVVEDYQTGLLDERQAM